LTGITLVFALMAIVLVSPGALAAGETATTDVEEESAAQVNRIDKPARDDLVQNTTAYIVHPARALVPGRPRIVAIALPSGKQKTIHTLPANANVHNLSGPDRSGRVAYIEDSQPNKRHRVKFVAVDGDKETTLFDRPGGAMWATTPVQTPGGVIGTHLALAPSGGNVAFLSNMNAIQMPGAYLHTGSLEIWNLDSKKQEQVVQTTALNQPMAWFTDGNRLAYTKLIPRKQIPVKGAGAERLRRYVVRGWKVVPAVFVLDTKTGKSTFLCVGWQSTISPDGKTAIVTGWSNLLQVNVETQKASPLSLPGIAMRAWDSAPVILGIARDGTVLYRGGPLKGKQARWTTGNSPLVGRKSMLTVRSADPVTGKTTVLIPYFDPRHTIAFGIPRNR
ncbi:MAG: hypothetical protein QGF59_17170, partial [Pirellulaceae bacterium]|nr:hypothetical protein [Pirellulaceae bacterium]